MWEFFKKIFSTEFMPHGHCYFWKPEIVWLNVASDALISLAYFSIPFTLLYFVRKRRDLEFPKSIFWLFCLFILACGITHTMEIWNVWHGAYGLAGMIKLLTAVSSIITALVLVRLVPKAIALPGPAQLKATNQELLRQINERNRAEQALRESMALSQSLFEFSPDAIIVAAADGRIVRVNSQIEKIFGYSKDELLDKSVEILLPDRFKERHAVHRVNYFADPRSRPIGSGLELFGRHKNGGEFPIDIMLSPVKTKDGTVALGVIRDITERKRAEQALRLQDVIVKSMSEGVCLIRDLDQTIVYANPKFDRMFGYDPDELIGKPFNILNAATDEAKAEEVAASILEQLAKTGEATYEAHNVKKDGTPFWCRAHTTIHDHPEYGLVWVAVHEDISKSKLAEEALQKAQAELELRVQHRTAELEKANEALQAEIAKQAKAERALKASEERLQLALDIAQMCTWDWELLTNDVAWAGHCNKIAGFPMISTEVDADSPICVVHEQDRQKITEALSRAREGGATFSAEFRIVRPGGTISWAIAQERGFVDETGKVMRLIGVVQDITERKMAEESLRKSEERYRQTLDTMLEGCQIIDFDWRYVYVNEAAASQGYRKREELLHHTMMEMYPGIEHTSLFATLRRCMEERVSEHLENEFTFPDGSVGWHELGIQPVPEGIFILSIDISERKRVEQSLRENEERLRLALQAANQGLYDLNVVTGDAVVSPEYATMLGYDPGEFKETNACWHKRLHPDDREPVYRVYEEYLAGKRNEYKVEFRQKMKTGEWKWILSLGKILARDDNGRPLRMLGTHTDITERKRAEAIVRQSEAKYHTLFESANDAIFLMQGQHFVDCNNRTLSIFGCERQDIIGQTPLRFSPECQADGSSSSEMAIEKINLALSGEPQHFEWRHLHGDGTPFEAEVSLNQVDINDDAFLLASVRDITDRKKYEEQLTASLKEKEVLLKEIHHRVKNNLQILSSLLKLQSRSTHDKHTQEMFEESQARVKTMALIHEELYSTSNLTKIEFASYVQNLANNLFRTYGGASKAIKLDIHVDDIQLDVDTAIPCGLIINELVSNSLKYAFPAERLAQQEHSENKIDIELRQQEDEHLMLKIRDNGVGLPADLDVGNTTTLGMQLVNTLTEQLSGKMEYHNHHGAEFAITFSSIKHKRRF